MPELSHGSNWPYVIIGALFALLGAACVVYAFVRQRNVDRAIARGDYSPPDERIVAALAISGTLLGLALVGILLAEA